MKYYYDLHLHSCLSPCADDESTPNSLAGFAKLCELDIVALTDHNSTLNCPAFFKACERYGVIPVAGMELTTSEDIHMVCLFPTLDSAMAFNDEISAHRMNIKNDPSIFGRQLVLDENDETVCELDELLSFATDISVDDAPELVEKYGGVCYPAHIDRSSNGIIAVLGTLPPTPRFGVVELRERGKLEELKAQHRLDGKYFVYSSDAHSLEMMSDAQNYVELPDGLSGEQVGMALVDFLKNPSGGSNEGIIA